MLEVTPDDIWTLRDDELRELVARLCSAELAAKGLPTAGVTSGGAQDAPDGGIDVRVSTADLAHEGWVPRHETGFQVKVPAMAPKAIASEMRPGGMLRSSISDLAARGGAYVVASSGSNLTDDRLAVAMSAMRDAVADDPNADRLTVRFYDRDRLARWARAFPGIAAWTLAAAGRPNAGWGPPESLTREPEGSAFVTAEDCAIVDGRAGGGRMPVAQGVASMRAALASPRVALRLVGLSGLGKTRLVQALFEPGVGEAPLDRAIGLYADQAAEPEPSPRRMATELVRSGARAILVVDNCTPDTHRALAATCRTAGSQVSLLTVEYDVREDEPEGTDVFRLEPATGAVLETVLGRRAPHLADPDRRRIANLSGGNFRIALALAATVERGRGLGTLTDAELFERLFRQRRAEDPPLLDAARALSLVYSYDGEDASEGSELATLATLAGQGAREMFAATAELAERGLVQKRSKWRAVLPHAVANRLATDCLARLPVATLEAALATAGAERLLKSSSRRLGYLHESADARALAARWLERWLGDVANLNPLGRELLRNLAPVAPAETLAVVAAAVAAPTGGEVTRPGQDAKVLCDLVHHIAYDPDQFDEAAALLARFLAAEPEGHRTNSVRTSFEGLFQLQLSFTRASPAQRRASCRALLSSQDRGLQAAGLAALSGLLRSGHFSSTHQAEFGARVRDFGWRPSTRAEVRDWFDQALRLAVDAAEETRAIPPRIRALVAENLRTLWMNTGATAAVSAAAERLAPWPDGWIAVRATLGLNAGNMDADALEKLRRLDRLLAPTDAMSEFEAYVGSPDAARAEMIDAEALGADDDGQANTSAWDRVCGKAEALGSLFAEHGELLGRVADRLVRPGQQQTIPFGRGLGGSPRAAEAWGRVARALRQAPDADRAFGCLAAMLGAMKASNPALRERILDDAMRDEALAPALPQLQSHSELDDADLDRLNRHLARSAADARYFRALTYQDVPGRLASRLADLTTRVAGLPGGMPIAIEILEAKIRMAANGEDEDLAEEYVRAARTILAAVRYEDGDQRMQFSMARLTRRCTAGAAGEATAVAMLANLDAAAREGRSRMWEHEDVVSALFETQPRQALDALLPTGDGGRRFRGLDWIRANPIRMVPDATLLAWVDEDRPIRLLPAALAVRAFKGRDSECAVTPMFEALWERRVEEGEVLEVLAERIHPGSWSGSLADILEARWAAVEALLALHPDPTRDGWLAEQRARIADRCGRERERDRRTDERFE